MKLLLSHIADPDGITPIILLNLLKEEFEYKLFEAPNLSKFIMDNLDNNYFDNYDTIFITDLGVNKECADKIESSKYKDKFKLFDHHESHNYLNDYSFATVIEEINGFKECGTSLFYKYLVDTYKNDILTKERLDVLNEIFDGIIEFMNDIISLLPDISSSDISNEVISKNFASLILVDDMLPEDIENEFYLEDEYCSDDSLNIFSLLKSRR